MKTPEVLMHSLGRKKKKKAELVIQVQNTFLHLQQLIFPCGAV